MNEVAYFEIQAENPSTLVQFYQEVFGWKGTRDDSIPIEYWRLQAGSIGGAILKRPSPKPQGEQGTNAYVCSMQVESFDDTSVKILQLGGIVALPKFAVKGKCWQGYFIDTEGNTFGIFQVDEQAE